MKHVITTMALSGIEALQGRAEDLAQTPALRESFHFVVSRAVAPLVTLAELCLPFCSIGGRFIAMKKGDMTAEMAAARDAIRILGGAPPHSTSIPSTLFDDNRTLITIVKRAPTPHAYPRRSGMPAHNPIHNR